jgi:PTS system galactitol-specific IIA component
MRLQSKGVKEVSTAEHLFRENLILYQVKGGNAGEILGNMAEVLQQQGHVTPGYKRAVIEREQSQPTGLPTSTVGIAIPHADPEHVLKPAICVGFPEVNVPFRVMGEEEETVDVGAVFMLAIRRTEDQLSLFQNLMDFIQDESLMSQLLASGSGEDAAGLLDRHLQA